MIKRLICGPGPRWEKKEGDVFIDRIKFPNVDVVHDLTLQWPFEKDMFDHVSAVHVVEHLPNLIHFMNEAWRVLKPGGSLYIETPLAGVNPDLEFSDPTHVRCYRIHTFANYFSLEGIEAFGYTDKAWNFFVLRVEGDCIQVHAYPIKN